MRFAYLIMAHTEPELLKTLLRCLDDERNDIFLHLDAKSPLQYEMFRDIPQRSALIPIPRLDIRWGGFSQVELELRLLEAACARDRYDYLHLLSGQDLPLRTQDVIHAFFGERAGLEFVSIEAGKTEKPHIQWRYRYYHWLKDFYGKNKGLLGKMDDALIRLQKPFVRRDRGCEYGGGHNWFSITGDFASYAVEHRGWIEKRFRHTYCADEIFLQTLLLQSPMRDRQNCDPALPDSLQCARLIDWERGGPYTFTIDDLEQLRSSPAMFARKFSLNKAASRQLVEALLPEICPNTERRDSR